jgi:hypothetical protein
VGKGDTCAWAWELGIGDGRGETGGGEIVRRGNGEARGRGVVVAGRGTIEGVEVTATGVIEGTGVDQQAAKMSKREIKIDIFSFIQVDDSYHRESIKSNVEVNAVRFYLDSLNKVCYNELCKFTGLTK